MLFEDAYNAFLAYIRHERGLAARTVSVYTNRLNGYRRWAETQTKGTSKSTAQTTAKPDNANESGPAVSRPLTDIFNATLLRRYLYSLSEAKLRPRTIRNRFAALRTFADYGVEQGWFTESPVHKIRLPKKDAAERTTVSDEELRALMDAVERQRDRDRTALERAMLYTLIMTGVRFQELLAIKVQHLDLDQGTLLVAHGKGEKSRLLYPSAECMAALTEWIMTRRKMRCKHDWLFAYDPARRMGDIGTRAMLEDIKASAGLADHSNIKPHALRRAFATRLMRAGADIRSIQAALGHSEAQTTFMYLQMRELPAQVMRDMGGLTPPPPSGATVSSVALPGSPASTNKPEGIAKTDATSGQRAELIRRMRRRPSTTSHL